MKFVDAIRMRKHVGRKTRYKVSQMRGQAFRDWFDKTYGLKPL